ncbi:MAG: hypothetical protein F6K35_40335, partial [Okeania sp. SIO2H7]|nr:hypothetical protein [Okeania sp. SIO2H7]
SFNVGVIKLSCKRVEPTQIDCQKSESKLLGLIEQSSSSLKRIENAKYNSETYTDSDGDTYKKYWVSVISQGQQVTVFRGSSRKMNAIATKIDRFVNSNEPLLVVRQVVAQQGILPHLGILIFSLLFATSVCFLAISILLVAGVPTFSFDKTSQTLSYENKKSLGITTRCHPFRDIEKVEIEEYIDDEDNRKSYGLKLLLPSVSATYHLMSAGENGLSEVQKMAEKLSKFLEIPISNKSSSS